MSRLSSKLFTPVDISWLALFRLLFGCVMLVEVGRYFAYGWVDSLARLDFNFTYYGFEWIHPWPGIGMHLHFTVLGVAAACVAVGFCYRVMSAVFFVAFSYVFLLDETRYLNHFYLICLVSFLMMFLPAHRAWSVDAWLRPSLRSATAPAWTLYLMRFQIGVPYFFGGVAKISSDWLQGEPMRKWLHERMSMPVISDYGHEEWFIYAFVLGGLLLDLLVVPCLLWKRTRVPAFFAVAAFHLMNSVLFHIGIFPWLMLGASVIFFPPEQIRSVLQKLHLPVPMAPGGSLVPSLKPLPSHAWRIGITSALVAYATFQVLMPFRHLWYPGDVHWTEEGHRFSWHMKLRTKRGRVLYDLYSPSTGRHWHVDPLANLVSALHVKMATHPDMILQYAHHLAEQKRQEGFADVEVRARALVSLNGRPPQDMVDPYVNFARQKRTLAHAEWILPLQEPLPPPTAKRSASLASAPHNAWFSLVKLPAGAGSDTVSQ